MPIYRLDPIDPGHPSWRFSVEKDVVWTNAASPGAARNQVAAKTGWTAGADLVSPWRNEAVVSCALEPTMSYPGPGEVVREDGSAVEFQPSDLND